MSYMMVPGCRELLSFGGISNKYVLFARILVRDAQLFQMYIFNR